MFKNVLIPVRKRIREGAEYPEKSIFHVFLPYLTEIHDHYSCIAVQQRESYARASQAFQMGREPSRADALQGGAIPDGGYWLPLKFGIVKFSHVSVQQDVCIQIQEPVILGKQAGSQKADVGQGGKSAAIPVLEGLEQFFRERGKMN